MLELLAVITLIGILGGGIAAVQSDEGDQSNQPKNEIIIDE